MKSCWKTGAASDPAFQRRPASKTQNCAARMTANRRIRDGFTRSYPSSATSLNASRAARIVLVTSASVCAAERNHASNCDGGG